jgi:predicted DNA-binding transcriptional regulator AlpA
MSELGNNPFDLLLEQIRLIVREEIAAASNVAISNPANTDVLLTPEEAAAMMNVERRWLIRHAKKFPFTRRISRKVLRFSEAGVRRWLATKKPSSNR